MPAVRINMRKLEDALRLKFEGELTHNQIAQALGISKGVVTKYVGLAVAAGLAAAGIGTMGYSPDTFTLVGAYQQSTDINLAKSKVWLLGGNVQLGATKAFCGLYQ